MAKKKSTKQKVADGEEAPQVNLLQMGREALQLQREAYPQQLELQQQYGADFARADVSTAQARANAEAGAIAADGGRMRQSILDTSPEIAAANRAQQARLGELGASGIETELQRQALTDLKLEGTLSKDELRQAIQGARGAMSARGIVNGNPAAVAEILNRQQFSDARLAARRNFAGQVDTATQQRKAGDAAISNNVFNTAGAFWDPQQRMFGTGGSAVTGQVQGPSQFAPYLSTGTQVALGNLDAASAFQGEQFANQRQTTQLEAEAANVAFNAQESRYLSAKKSKASNTAGWASAAGTVLGIAALPFL